MTHNRPRASIRIWIGLMSPSFSEAKRLTSNPSAIWNEASSSAGSCETFSSAANTGVAMTRIERTLTNRMRSAFDSSFGISDERSEAFHFLREPADFRIAMIAAARLFGAVATEKGPILRTPIIKPQTILRANFLSQLFKRGIRPNAVFVRNARVCSHIAGADLARECRCQDCLAARRELKSIGGQVAFAAVELFC